MKAITGFLNSVLVEMQLPLSKFDIERKLSFLAKIFKTEEETIHWDEQEREVFQNLSNLEDFKKEFICLKQFKREKAVRAELDSDFANFQKEFRIACEPSDIIDKMIKIGCMNGIFYTQKSLPPTDFEKLLRHLCPLMEIKRSY